MALQLQDVLTAARDRHPSFHKSRVTNAVLARFLTDYQNGLIARAAERDKMFLAQSIAVALSIDDANDPGTVGAGSSGGLPGDVSSAGSVSVVQESAGTALQPKLASGQGANILVAERVVTAATSTTVSSTGAGRTVNQDLGRLVFITTGKGRGQVRAILSNTAEQWVVSAWDTIPDTTSLMVVVAASLIADDDFGVVTEVPAQTQRTAYLVRLNAQGVPYIDYTKPLTIWIDRGVPLPSLTGGGVLGGTLRYTDGDEGPLCITTYGRRYGPPELPAVYLVGEQLFLCGDEQDWTDVNSIELRYTPIAPVFTALTDYFLVPDAARPTLVAQAAAFAAGRVAGAEGITIDVADFDARAMTAEERYLGSFRLAKRGRGTTFRKGAY